MQEIASISVNHHESVRVPMLHSFSLCLEYVLYCTVVEVDVSGYQRGTSAASSSTASWTGSSFSSTSGNCPGSPVALLAFGMF